MNFKKYIIASILLFSCISLANAQGGNAIDSLKHVFESAKTDSARASTLELLNMSYSRQARYEDAMKAALDALAIYRKIGNKRREAAALDAVGQLYFFLLNTNKAIEYMKMGLAIREKLGIEMDIARSYGNLGIMYKEQDKYDTAMKYQQMALSIYEKNGNKKLMGMCYNNIGLIYDKKGDYEQDLKYLDKSLAIKIEMNDRFGIASTYQNMGTAYCELEKYDKAIEYLEKGLAIDKEDNLVDKIMNADKALATAYALKDKHNKAYDYFLEYSLMRDSLLTQKSIEQINNLVEKYKADKREEDIKLLEEKSLASAALADKRTLYFIIAVISGFLLLASLLLYFARLNNKKKQREIELVKNTAEYEQKALRAQMNPHFIFNALNSIQHYILSNESQYAYDYLAKFSKLIRQVLTNSERSTITLNKEIELLETYIDLEQRRFKNRFNYQIKYSPDIVPADIVIPVMLIQPYVENAIWHGIMNLDENVKGNLTVNFDLHNNDLKITIEDNGVGREKAAKLRADNEHESVGMLFSKKRLEILKSISNVDTRITVIDLHDDKGQAMGTRVEIILPTKN